MKKSTLWLVASMLLWVLQTKAQAPFMTKNVLDINNIQPTVLVHGDLWYNPETITASCEYPPASGKHINFTGALWMSGYDGGGQLHVAAQTYRQDGNDYWPGPLDAADTLTYTTSTNWAKIWKVNRTDITNYLALATHTTANTPDPILTWPAKGNTHATGAGGASLSITTNMAPFVDINGNGIYEPLAGDYPSIKGDQALWWVFSDNGPTHNNTNSHPLGVEVHAMAYGYKRGTVADNIVYYDYTIVNRSSRTYNNFRLGLWDDIDLGYFLDDYIGFDSSHRMGIAYNGSADDGEIAGSPANSYGTQVPITGITLLVLPGDNPAAHTRVPAGSFTYYNNVAGVIGNPTVGGDYDNYLRSKLKDGTHISNDFIGHGIFSYGYGSGPQCNYVFPGDPIVNTQWSECASTNPPGDRRFIITSNDFTLAAGASQRIVMAQVVTPLENGNGCPTHGFAEIKTIADSAWYIFDTSLASEPNAVPAIHNNDEISIYPNPAHSLVHIDDLGRDAHDAIITVHNTIGQAMHTEYNKNTGTLDISAFPAGVYHILYTKPTQQYRATIVKD